MNIKDLKKWINSLPTEFDEFELTHREYYDTDGDKILANEIDVASVHVDSNANKICFMHEESYRVYRGNELISKLSVPSTKVEI
jgi:hypothetical protein